MMTNSGRQITGASKNVSRIRIRSGASFARSPDIDGFLNELDVKVLYKRWKSEEWGEPIVLRGGIVSLTCDMLLEIPWKELVKTYGVKRAKRLLEAGNKGSLKNVGR